ncbi:DJ-1/PfpI family protein [Nocardia abscessus]|uniref:DJ-1/PfpI family protein n=1 Tax=Nocardia abscessus TaxID=120957 RepID=UPI001E3E6E27|nr:DJ-1/PfpI family protein [Nocardia abscessus]
MSSNFATRPRRRVGVLVFDGVKMLDFVGPAEVFVEANQSVAGYEVVAVSADGKDAQTSIGARVEVSCAAAFAAGLDPAKAKVLAVSQRPLSAIAFNEPASAAAWKTKPA